jgi:phosphoribosylanthranilate isomerase
MFLKVCGITRREDATHAVQHGATALGFVFWPRSPRNVRPDHAAEIIAGLPSNVTPVGVFVDEEIDTMREVIARTGIKVVQLHGDEPPVYAAALELPLLRAVTIDEAPDVADAWPADTTLLLDAIDPLLRGGTGQTIDWNRAAALARRTRVVLAGGLTALNVSEAIAAVRPFGVDVSSGVEAAPGIKDSAKVARFLERAQAAFEQHGGQGTGNRSQENRGQAWESM